MGGDEAVGHQFDVIIGCQLILQLQQGLSGAPGRYARVDDLVLRERLAQQGGIGFLVLNTLAKSEASTQKKNLRTVVASGRHTMSLAVDVVGDVIDQRFALLAGAVRYMCPPFSTVRLPDPYLDRAKDGGLYIQQHPAYIDAGRVRDREHCGHGKDERCHKQGNLGLHVRLVAVSTHQHQRFLETLGGARETPGRLRCARTHGYRRRIAAQIFSLVMGIESISTPTALRTALAMAGAVGTMACSPMPRAP